MIGRCGPVRYLTGPGEDRGGEDLSEASGLTAVTPGLIMRLGSSFIATRPLLAASEVGVFEALADGALDLDALAARIAVPRRTARICSDAMVAWACWNETGLCTGTVLWPPFLTGRGRSVLRPFLRYLNVGLWCLASSPVPSGRAKAAAFGPLDPHAQRVFSAGVESATATSPPRWPTVTVRPAPSAAWPGRGNRVVPGSHPRPLTPL